jgi:putative ABC transport system substrate-binding protein
MNNRRKLVIALGAGALAAPFASNAQQQGKVLRLGILESASATSTQASEKVFVDTLRELGWVEGRNITYDRVFADGDVSRLQALAAALVKREPNLIYSIQASAIDAAVAATRTIPILLGSHYEWIERGWAQSLSHPGGNITGILNIGPELGSKRLQLLKQALPKVTRVGVLVNPVTSGGAKELQLIERAASGLRVTVVSAFVKQPGELENAFASFAKNRVEAILTAHSDLFLTERRRVLDLASKQRVAVIAHRSGLADDGALMSYSSILTEQIRRAAHLADKILKGTKPGDIPVELPTRFELVVNNRTAKALGIALPGEVMLQATRVIE